MNGERERETTGYGPVALHAPRNIGKMFLTPFEHSESRCVNSWVRVWGLRFGVWGVGCGVRGLGFGVWGLGFGV